MDADLDAGSFRDHGTVSWGPAPGYDVPGAEQKILLERSGGAHVRLVRWPAGFVTGLTALNHPDADEFAWVVSGRSVSLVTGREATPGAFCSVPAGLDHGPFTTPDGVMLLEVRLPVGRYSALEERGTP